MFIEPNNIETNCSVIFGYTKTNGVSSKAGTGGKGKYLWLLKMFTS